MRGERGRGRGIGRGRGEGERREGEGDRFYNLIILSLLFYVLSIVDLAFHTENRK